MSTCIAKHIAVDFGAESGRIVVGKLFNDKIELEVVHRFPTRQVRLLNSHYWDFPYLFAELKEGLKAVVRAGHGDACSIAVDTWGVDFGLIDKKGNLMGLPYTYRDSRTKGMPEEAFKIIPKEELFALTGNQFMQLNTAFQLLSMVKGEHPALKEARHLLFTPDLFNYFLTGKCYNEYTIASTSQLLHAGKRDWSREVFAKLQLPDLSCPMIQPGQVVGTLLEDIALETGLKDVLVVAVGSHDTASAVAAVPQLTPGRAYLSSGTWSLLGVELDEAILTPDALKGDFTNEGGIGGKIRFLRNATGMWINQQLRKAWHTDVSPVNYAEMTQMAVEATPFTCAINTDAECFSNPVDMPAAICRYAADTQQQAPRNKGEMTRTVYESLAFKYKSIIEKMNACIPNSIDSIHVVGGGSRNELLNRFIADACGLPVFAGPVEATALGNIMMQAIGAGHLESIEAGRKLVASSEEIQYYTPTHSEEWNTQYQKIKQFIE